MSFTNRSYQKELLDGDNIPFRDIIINMRELNVVNSFLGGHRITRKGVIFFLRQVKTVTPLAIVEIGCGGGDNLTAIHQQLIANKHTAHLTGIDIKPECIAYAKQNAAKEVTFICSDYRDVSWSTEHKPDIIFSSLFCHHFADEELAMQLKWMKENSRLGFFINDIHRHPIAYYSIYFLTRLFSKSYLVKNDAPLSVKRAFKKNDWVKIFSAAGITQYTIKWQWAFRYLICARND